MQLHLISKLPASLRTSTTGPSLREIAAMMTLKGRTEEHILSLELETKLQDKLSKYRADKMTMERICN